MGQMRCRQRYCRSYSFIKPNPPKNEFSPPVIHKILDYADPVKVEFEVIKQIVKQQIKSKKYPGYDLITLEMIKKSA